MRPFAFVALALLTSACGSSGNAGSGFDSNASGAPNPGVDASSGVDTAAPPQLASDASFGEAGGGSGGPSEVYGNSADTLYKLDPDTKAVTVVGAFKGCTSVL